MEIEFVGGPIKNIEKEVQNRIRESDEISIAVAFLSNSGVERIIEAIRTRKEKDGKISIITSLGHDITEPDALRKLLEYEVDCKIIDSDTFHPKLYIFKKAGDFCCIIGSSNLSEGGLFSNYEANVILRGNDSDSSIKESIDYFSDLWENPDCISLDEQIINIYEKRKEYTERIISKRGERYQEFDKKLKEYASMQSEIAPLLSKADEKYNESIELYKNGKMFESYNSARESFDIYGEIIIQFGENYNYLNGRRAYALVGMGTVYRELLKLDEAREYIDEAEKIFRKLGLDYEIGLMMSFVEGALIRARDGKLSLAAKKCKKFFEVYNQVKDQMKNDFDALDKEIGFDNFAHIHATMADYELSLGNKIQARNELEQAIKYHTMALKKAQNEGNDFGRAMAHLNLGRIYDMMGKIEPKPSECIRQYENAKAIFEELKSPFWVACVTKNIGQLYACKKREYKRARDYLDKAYEIYKRLGHKERCDEVKAIRDGIN